MSLRDRVSEKAVKALVRSTMKPLIRPPLPVSVQRRIVAALSAANVTPKGVEIARASGAPVPTERVVAKQGDPERVVIYLHGGGYVLGSPRTHRPTTGGLARTARAEVLVPEYRLAPEHPFPAARDDALAVYQWVLEQGAEPSAVTIGGDSAGGGLTVSAALEIRDQELPMPGALFLISPWVDVTLSSETFVTMRAREVMLNHRWPEQAGRAYAGSIPRDDAGISPLFADLAGLPPTLLHVGSEEILLGEARALDQKLREAGVDAELVVFDGLWHDFHLHAPLLRRSVEALEAAGSFIRSYA